MPLYVSCGAQVAIPLGSGFTRKPTIAQPAAGADSLIVCAAVVSTRCATSLDETSASSPTAHAPVFGPPGVIEPAKTAEGCVAVPVTFWIRTTRVVGGAV